MRYIFRKNQFQDDDCDTLFNVRGEVLCHMNVDDFLWRSPSAGAFLHENLDVWKMGECLSVHCVWKMGECLSVHCVWKMGECLSVHFTVSGA